MSGYNAYQTNAPETAYATSMYMQALKDRKSLLDALGDILLSKEGVLSNIDSDMRKYNTGLLQQQLGQLSDEEIKDMYARGETPLDFVASKNGTGFVYDINDKNLNDKIKSVDDSFKTRQSNIAFNDVANMSDQEKWDIIKNGGTLAGQYNKDNLDYVNPLDNMHRAMLDTYTTNVRKKYSDLAYNQALNKSQEDIANTTIVEGKSLLNEDEYPSSIYNPLTPEQRKEAKNKENSVKTNFTQDIISGWEALTPYKQGVLYKGDIRNYVKKLGYDPARLDQTLISSQVGSDNINKGEEARRTLNAKIDQYTIQELDAIRNAKTKDEIYEQFPELENAPKDVWDKLNTRIDDAHKELRIQKIKENIDNRVYGKDTQGNYYIKNSQDAFDYFNTTPSVYDSDGKLVEPKTYQQYQVDALDKNAEIISEIVNDFHENDLTSMKDLRDAHDTSLKPAQRQAHLDAYVTNLKEYLTKNIPNNTPVTDKIFNTIISKINSQIEDSGIMVNAGSVLTKEEIYTQLENAGLSGDDIDIIKQKGMYLGSYKGKYSHEIYSYITNKEQFTSLDLSKKEEQSDSVRNYLVSKLCEELKISKNASPEDIKEALENNKTFEESGFLKNLQYDGILIKLLADLDTANENSHKGTNPNSNIKQDEKYINK